MKKSAYVIEELSIRKSPGFVSGLSTMRELAPNVNIITGPNASGKSTTARAIQELIWHKNTKGLSLHGSVKIEKDRWEIDIDSGSVTTTRNGHKEQLNGLPAQEGHHRYLLALHNFVDGNENELAKEIAKQSIGGFDLQAAHDTLGYSPKTQTLGSSTYKAYTSAEKEYQKTRDLQRELKQEEDQLSALSLQKDEALNAQKKFNFFKNLAEFQKLKIEFQLLDEKFEEYPSAIQRLKGNEPALIQRNEEEIQQLEDELQKANDEIERRKKAIEEHLNTDVAFSDQEIDEVEARINQLTEMNRQIHESHQQISQEETKEKAALTNIDSTLDTSKLDVISIEDINGLDKLLRDAHQVLGKKKVLETEVDHLEESIQQIKHNTPPTDTLTLGIKTLAEWLKEPLHGTVKPNNTAMWVLMFGLLASFSSRFIGWIGQAIGVICLGIGAFLILKNKKGSSSSETLNVREDDFKKSGLTPPSQWDTTNVVQKIDELIDQLKEGKEKDHLDRRLKDCKNRLHLLQNQLNQLKAQHQKWKDKLNAIPEFPNIDKDDFSSLYWYLIQIKNWQEANTALKAKKVKKDNLETLFEEELNKIKPIFSRLTPPFPKDLIALKSQFTNLKKLLTERKENQRVIHEKQEAILGFNKQLNKNKQQLKEVYKSIGVEENDKNTIISLSKKLEEFQLIVKERFAAERAFNKAIKHLELDPLYAVHQSEINDMGPDEISQIINENAEKAQKIEEIQNQIITIETKVNEKRKGHELEDLISKKDERRTELYQSYEENLAAQTGDMIIEELKKETQNKNRPEVFKRANQIFNKITLGRYELMLNEMDDTTFEAKDKVSKRTYQLTELSTGTRVQLLLAVRLAYVETIESAIKLPILADELLANSDDERAKAIIEALIEISREGRQVFYFTAQVDEVEKWYAHLNQSELEYKIIALDQKENEDRFTNSYAIDKSQFNLTTAVPHPEGKTHETYRQEITVPTFDLLSQNKSQLHLWYLIQDVEILYAILKKGINYWGQLESYLKNDGKIDGLNKDKTEELNAYAGVLGQFQELYRIGRYRVVDRTVLQNSGIISENFIDKVAEKLKALKGNPQALLDALENGEVSRFRKDSVGELKNYFVEHGFIDEQEVLSPDEIRLRLQAHLSNVQLPTTEVEQFLSRVGF